MVWAEPRVGGSARFPLQGFGRTFVINVTTIEARDGNTMAAELQIGARAVEKHINSIFAKLGLTADDDMSHRRVQAVLTFLSKVG